MPCYGHSTRESQPYTKVDKHGQLYYVIVDSEGEYECPSPDINDLLYLLFRSIAFSMAAAFLANNVIEKEDYHRRYFSKHFVLLSMLNKDWGDRAEQEQQVILKFTPFDDVKNIRENSSK